MDIVIEYLQQHPNAIIGLIVTVIVMLADAIVAKTPCKWDDIILTTIKKAFSKWWKSRRI
jgi:hypothetical protein